MEDYSVKVKNYRDRAAEIRTIAEELLSKESRRVLSEVAEDYERMAETIEKIITSQRYVRSRGK